MKSMTGYGQAQLIPPGMKLGLRADISSINRKQLEVKMTLPHELAQFETKVRLMVAEKVSRGCVTVRISYPEGMTPDTTYSINRSLVEMLVKSAAQISDEYKIDGSLNMAELLSVPGVVRPEESDFSGGLMEESLCTVLQEALVRFNASRETEGRQLAQDISMRLKLVEETLEKIIPFAADLPEIQYKKLLARLRELDLPAAKDDERLLRELVLYADKLDVTEEVTRLRSHFRCFDALLHNETDSVGRQMDFTVQEIFREINTLGNKAVSTDISPLVVIIKTELEKIREQVQNIE